MKKACWPTRAEILAIVVRVTCSERLSALSSAGQRIRQPLFFPMLNFAHRFDFLHYRFVPAPWLFSRSHIGLIAVVMSYATLRLNFLSRSEITRHRLRSLNDNILLRWRRCETDYVAAGYATPSIKVFVPKNCNGVALV